MRWLGTSTYVLSGNVIEDVVEAETFEEAWDKIAAMKYRHVESVELTEWNGKTNCYGICNSGSYASINNYNPN